MNIRYPLRVVRECSREFALTDLHNTLLHPRHRLMREILAGLLPASSASLDPAAEKFVRSVAAGWMAIPAPVTTGSMPSTPTGS